MPSVVKLICMNKKIQRKIDKTRLGDFSSLSLLILSYSIFFSPSFPELNTGQIQEGVGEAINGIVKHFHKPEKEVRDNRLDRPRHVVLLFITNDEEQLSPPVVSEPLSNSLTGCVVSLFLEMYMFLL